MTQSKAGTSPNLTLGPPEQRRGLASTFAALYDLDYRLFFTGALLSNMGTWMQAVAQGWLVVTLTNSDFLVGLVGFFGMLPSLFLSLVGGVLADRVDKRGLLIFTNVVQGLLAVLLGFLITTGRVQIWHIMAISFANGVMLAVGSPAWQAIVPEIVGRKNLLNAIALNSAQFNLTRAIGPSVGGFLIRLIGIAGAFYANAVSYVAFLVAIAFVHPKHAAPTRAPRVEGMGSQIVEGLAYCKRHRLIRPIMILASAQTIFLFPYSTLLPIFAKDVLHLGASGYALLLTMAGLGALTGALMLAFLGDVRSKGRWLFWTQIILIAAVAVFAVSRWLPLVMLSLAFVGWAFVAFLATGNTLLQTMVPDELRGRVMSVWVLTGLGLMPVASLLAGSISSLIGPTLTLLYGAGISLVFTLALFARNRVLLEPRIEDLPVGLGEGVLAPGVT